MEGSFAPGHDAHAERLGSFGNVDRDTVTTFPCAVEDVSVVSHHRLVALLAEAGLDREIAERDVDALHEGRLLVVARVRSGVAALMARHRWSGLSRQHGEALERAPAV